ncbi:MAG: hypothetical protein IPM35_00840 [Myxococcales bacterium]|nr:hypothetical protein [Myxococcales bacterium]
MSASDSADDIPPTPKNAASSQDTERDLPPPERRSSARPAAPSEELDSSTTLGEHTLLSVKAAADRLSERPDHRVDELDRRLVQLEARLKVLELQRAGGSLGDKRWLFWVGLMLALILGWQLRAFFR